MQHYCLSLHEISSKENADEFAQKASQDQRQMILGFVSGKIGVANDKAWTQKDIDCFRYLRRRVKYERN